MNNEQQEQEIVRLLNRQKGIRPSEAVVRAALAKLPVRSPYRRGFASRLSSLQKFGITLAAATVLITGGLVVNHRLGQTPAGDASQQARVQSGGTSDAALDQDLKAIDDQMNALDGDNANADQALSS